jgi:hypothetical protein
MRSKSSIEIQARRNEELSPRSFDSIRSKQQRGKRQPGLSISSLSLPHACLIERGLPLVRHPPKTRTCLAFEPKPALLKSFFSISFHLFPLLIPVDIAITNILGCRRVHPLLFPFVFMLYALSILLCLWGGRCLDGGFAGGDRFGRGDDEFLFRVQEQAEGEDIYVSSYTGHRAQNRRGS